jgi:hypothetical protein
VFNEHLRCSLTDARICRDEPTVGRNSTTLLRAPRSPNVDRLVLPDDRTEVILREALAK